MIELTDEEIIKSNKIAEELNCDTRIIFIITLLEKASDIPGVNIDFGTGTGAFGCKCALANSIAYYLLDFKKGYKLHGANM